jgi:Domain of unknown function (DUF4333)
MSGREPYFNRSRHAPAGGRLPALICPVHSLEEEQMPKPLRVAGAAAILVAALTLSSCGATVVDDGKAEDQIKANVEHNTGLKVSVKCPAGVEVETGRSFSCTVTTRKGEKAKAVLRILDSDADVHFIALRALK